jgi:hypothetical protein
LTVPIGLALAVQPAQLPAALPAMHQQPARRNRGSHSANAGAYRIGDGPGLAGELEPLRVEPLGHQYGSAQPEQVARRVPAAAVRDHDAHLFPQVAQRSRVDSRLFWLARHKEQNPPARQQLRKPMASLPTARIGCRQRLGRASGGGNSVEP